MIMTNKKCIVVYIHGFHGSYKEAKIFNFLSDKYDVVGIDYENRNPWEVKDRIISEFQRLTKGYDDVILIGYSIGAFHCYEFLNSFKINHAFFIAPVARMYSIGMGMMKQNHISEEELKEKGEIAIGDGQILSYSFNQHLKNDPIIWDVPTDILYASNDKLIALEDVIWFLKDHPKSRLTIKKDSEHHILKTSEEQEFVKQWILRGLN